MPLDFTALFALCDLHASRVADAWPDERPMYYDRQGFPIPSAPGDAGADGTLAWARLNATPGYKRVAVDTLPDGSVLSTVWLGLDHSHLMGPPLIFETMRFRGASHDPLPFPDPSAEEGDTTQLRSATEEEALAVHHEIVRRLRLRDGH